MDAEKRGSPLQTRKEKEKSVEAWCADERHCGFSIPVFVEKPSRVLGESVQGGKIVVSPVDPEGEIGRGGSRRMVKREGGIDVRGLLLPLVHDVQIPRAESRSPRANVAPKMKTSFALLSK
jgi:hypothetical protein